MTASFTINFPHDGDVCYLGKSFKKRQNGGKILIFLAFFFPAYHYPYTYSRMKANLDTISNKVPENMYLKIDWLAESPGKKIS